MKYVIKYEMHSKALSVETTHLCAVEVPKNNPNLCLI